MAWSFIIECTVWYQMRFWTSWKLFVLQLTMCIIVGENVKIWPLRPYYHPGDRRISVIHPESHKKCSNSCMFYWNNQSKWKIVVNSPKRSPDQRIPLILEFFKTQTIKEKFKFDCFPARHRVNEVCQTKKSNFYTHCRGKKRKNRISLTRPVGAGKQLNL